MYFNLPTGNKDYKSLLKKPVNFVWVILFLVSALTLLWAAVISFSSDLYFVPTISVRPKPKIEKAEEEKPKWVYIPGPISMKVMKTKGCVADGFLSGYGENPESMSKLINRSECLYLHRAVETWLATPDFEEAREVMQKIKKPGVIYGMFIAEALSKKGDYFYPEENRKFKFSEMCRGGSDNVWGEHTCKPSFEKKEYRKYLQVITQQAMDLGIQSFMFGQIYFQEDPDLEKSEMPKIIREMRQYAMEKGMDIAIGAQTNDITDEEYLRLFDYIEGGVGIDSQGNIESGPCLSRKGSCWALLWNDAFAKKANNVFLHLDWSGLLYDDMSVFARMDKKTRERTLANLYSYFTSRDMGFMMPFLATINRQNNGCYGPKKRFYSPDNKYLCQDEDAIRKIMLGEYK